MASPAQIRANRLNAQHSTGPRTEAGKQKTSFNAISHGLTAAKMVVLPTEDQKEFEALRLQLQEEHAPSGKLEQMLVDEIAHCWWRLRRARLHEKGAAENMPVINQDFFQNYLGPILRYMASAERGWHRAITQLRAVQSDRRKHQPKPAPAEEPVPVAIPLPAQFDDIPKVMAVGSVSSPSLKVNNPASSAHQNCLPAQAG
jgi:hypothetical protein